jgi:hypothetical protein
VQSFDGGHFLQYLEEEKSENTLFESFPLNRLSAIDALFLCVEPGPIKSFPTNSCQAAIGRMGCKNRSIALENLWRKCDKPHLGEDRRFSAHPRDIA